MRAGPREGGHTLVHPTGPPEPPYGRERTPPQTVKPQPGHELRGCTGWGEGADACPRPLFQPQTSSHGQP